MKVTIFRTDDAGGRLEVECFPTPVPGLVINQDPSLDGWNVTHFASGAALIVDVPDPELALDIVIKVGDLADWTMPGTALRARKDLARKVLKVRDDMRLYTRANAVSLSRLAAVEATP